MQLNNVYYNNEPPQAPNLAGVLFLFLRGGLNLRLIAVFFLLFPSVQPFENVMRDYVHRNADNESLNNLYYNTPFLLPYIGVAMDLFYHIIFILSR